MSYPSRSKAASASPSKMPQDKSNMKELTQLEIIVSFLNKRHALFRDQCAKKRFHKSP